MLLQIRPQEPGVHEEWQDGGDLGACLSERAGAGPVAYFIGDKVEVPAERTDVVKGKGEVGDQASLEQQIDGAEKANLLKGLPCVASKVLESGLMESHRLDGIAGLVERTEGCEDAEFWIQGRGLRGRGGGAGPGAEAGRGLRGGR